MIQLWKVKRLPKKQQLLLNSSAFHDVDDWEPISDITCTAHHYRVIILYK